MEWKIENSVCDGQQLYIIQEQGENSPTIINIPYDVTDYTFTGTINFPTPIVVTIGSGITVISAAEGSSQISLQLDSADTQDVVEGDYAFDLWTTSPGGTNSVLFTGYFIIKTAITVIS